MVDDKAAAIAPDPVIGDAPAHRIAAGLRTAADLMPNRWWQWLLLYPTLGVSLLTAAPHWADGILAAVNNVENRSFSEAKLQSELWAKNLSCTALPMNYIATDANVELDATICNSGDIFVRAQTSDHRFHFYWVPVDRVIGREVQKPPLFGAAEAAEEPLVRARLFSAVVQGAVERSRLFTRVQMGIICQRLIDPRHVVRRITTPQGCFDQMVDTFTGQVVSMQPAPCSPC